MQSCRKTSRACHHVIDISQTCANSGQNPKIDALSQRSLVETASSGMLKSVF